LPYPSLLQPKKSKVAIALYSALAAFLTYTMIFGFRKAFTVATFENQFYWGLGYKTLIVIAQVLGYLAAKFYGIKFIAELKREMRWKIILLLTGIAWTAWLGFAICPAPWNILFAAINGFPLGMLWGVVFSYIEGRRTTDFLGAALAVSFIFSSGFVKSVGGWLMANMGTDEKWIPFLAGLVFAGPLILFVWMIEKIPPPNQQDEDERMERKPLGALERKKIFAQFLPGLILTISIYMLATIFREIRDNFSADMWVELGYIAKPEIFTLTEIPVTLGILVIIGSLTLVRNSKTAFALAHVIIALGFCITGGASLLFSHALINPFTWMIGTGVGLYLVYIPFNSVYFERMIAAFRISGNVGFLIYIADSIGYLGSVAVLLSKEVFRIKMHWVQFFLNSTTYLSMVGLALTIITSTYFYIKFRHAKS
jgi:MFS family permease